MLDKDKIWKMGESAALEYLRNQGYRIIEQNYRTRYSEIDIVAKKDRALVFVEVRSKKGEMFGSPEETINGRKLKKLGFNAESYVKTKNWLGQYRIDAVCVVFNQNNEIKRLDHYRDII